MFFKCLSAQRLACALLLGLAAGCGDDGVASEIGGEGSDSTSDGSDSSDSSSDSSDSSDSTDTGIDPNDDCVSDMYWMSGNMGSQFMHPGRDCLDCHQDFNEIPGLVLAGTVYRNLHEVDECDGVQGVTVTITDATGAQFQTSTNVAGNFGLFNVPLVPPYTARLDWQGRTREMVAAQTPKSCNSCHTQAGTDMAPGRIIAP